MPNIEPDRGVHVVAGILIEDQRVFLTRRPPGTHLAGKWEFPGGKVMPGEDAYAALRRELAEEIGIEVLQAIPYTQIHHHYSDKDVYLDVWRVSNFRGKPHGREGQDAQWHQIENLRPSVFPAADQLVVRRLQLPRLYAISAAGRIGAQRWLALLEQAVDAGLQLLQLREPDMAHAEFEKLAHDAIEICHARGARVMVNDSPALAVSLKADGVHLNSVRLREYQHRPLAEDLLVGASCHTAGELHCAQQISADLIAIGAVKSTGSHPHATPLGWDAFAQLSALTKIPVYALGGLSAQDMTDAQEHGAHGLAMISALWNSRSIASVVQACANER